MSNELGTIRRFKVPHDMESEGRRFYEKETYEAHYKEGWFNDGGLNVHLYAENGYFNFTDELFERVIVGWGLMEVSK